MLTLFLQLQRTITYDAKNVLRVVAFHLNEKLHTRKHQRACMSIVTLCPKNSSPGDRTRRSLMCGKAPNMKQRGGAHPARLPCVFLGVFIAL